MGGAEGGSLMRAPAARRVRGSNNRWLLNFLLCTIAVTAVTVVVAAAMLGQSTVALVVALVSAAFFAGLLS